jgi:hypothetical protein
MALALLIKISIPPKRAAVSATASATRDYQWQSLATRCFNRFGCGVDRAFETRVSRGGLGGDGDIGAVLGGTQGNGQPDATAAA